MRGSVIRQNMLRKENLHSRVSWLLVFYFPPWNRFVWGFVIRLILLRKGMFNLRIDILITKTQFIIPCWNPLFARQHYEWTVQIILGWIFILLSRIAQTLFLYNQYFWMIQQPTNRNINLSKPLSGLIKQLMTLTECTNWPFSERGLNEI